jgi:hypothetical protein
MRGTRDWKAMSDLAEDVDTRLSSDQKTAARRTVCSTAARLGIKGELSDDELTPAALEVCMMLGIHPSQVDDDSYRDVDLYRDAPSLDSVHR